MKTDWEDMQRKLGNKAKKRPQKPTERERERYLKLRVLGFFVGI
jgi:hypothetical protein